MLEARRAIVDAVRTHKLPDRHEEIIHELIEAGKFVVQESLHWDYKRDFPFSHSDPYFGGILRLVCAFYNTYGGIIVFGVHDEHRTPGHNLVKINIERVNSAIREKLNVPIECVHKSYELTIGDGTEKIDILLIPKRPMGVAPARFAVGVGPYKAGTIWIRKGHEVLAAKSSDFPLLYGSRNGYGVEDDDLAPISNSQLP